MFILNYFCTKYKLIINHYIYLNILFLIVHLQKKQLIHSSELETKDLIEFLKELLRSVQVGC